MSLSIRSSTAVSGSRMSIMKNTSPGTTLGEPGFASSRPTVPTASDAACSATALIASTMRAAPSSASCRRGIGVVPAWVSCPVTVTSYQRMACTPVTTPMSLRFCFEIRPLLDVDFEERRQRVRAAALRPAIADLAPAHRRTLRRCDPGALRRPVAGEHAGEHAGRDHRRGEARAFLVGPVDRPRSARRFRSRP